MAEAAVRRPYQVYLYVVCFVAVLTLLVAASLALFGLVRVVVPDQTAAAPQLFPGPFPEQATSVPVGAEDLERKRGLAQFLNNTILAGIAGLLFALHWRRANRLRDSFQPHEET